MGKLYISLACLILSAVYLLYFEDRIAALICIGIAGIYGESYRIYNKIDDESSKIYKKLDEL